MWLWAQLGKKLNMIPILCFVVFLEGINHILLVFLVAHQQLVEKDK